MKKDKKYVASDGIQYFMCPFTEMRITQGSNGEYSHKGTMSNDVNGTKSGVRYAYYAPCDVKCIGTVPSYGQAFWQSLNKVRFGNGRVDYATFVTAHDDSFDAKKGQVVKQGSQLGNMGKKSPLSNITGIHCHIQIAQGKYGVKDYKENQYKNPKFPVEYDTDDCYLCDDTTILNCKTANWKYIKDVPVHVYKKVGATAGLFLRAGVGTSTKKLKLLVYNTKVEVLEDNAGSNNGYNWSKVKVGNTIGYVANKYLK